MHDWIIKEIRILWKERQVSFFLRYNRMDFVLIASNVRNFDAPMLFEWGPSRSINETTPYLDVDSGYMKVEDWERKLSIEMQTGDVITIEAESIVLQNA